MLMDESKFFAFDKIAGQNVLGFLALVGPVSLRKFHALVYLAREELGPEKSSG